MPRGVYIIDIEKSVQMHGPCAQCYVLRMVYSPIGPKDVENGGPALAWRFVPGDTHDRHRGLCLYRALALSAAEHSRYCWSNILANECWTPQTIGNK
jgi:hypothetical protein